MEPQLTPTQKLYNTATTFIREYISSEKEKPELLDSIIRCVTEARKEIEFDKLLDEELKKAITERIEEIKSINSELSDEEVEKIAYLPFHAYNQWITTSQNLN